MVKIVFIEKIADADVRLEGHVDIWRKSIPGRWKGAFNGRSFLLCFRMNVKAVCLFYKTVQVYKSSQNNCWDECEDPEVRYFFIILWSFLSILKKNPTAELIINQFKKMIFHFFICSFVSNFLELWQIHISKYCKYIWQK